MASENISPWLEQLRRTRPVVNLSGDAGADVAIVGGGISGVATAYFILHDTDRRVVMLEGGLVAHGATGHNGGQAVASFERLALELSEEFGEDLVSEGLKDIDSAWDLLRSMIDETGIDPGLQETSSYAGISSYEDLEVMLLEIQLWHRLGLYKRRLFVAEDVAGKIPDECRSLFQSVTRERLNHMLLARDNQYICAMENNAGLMNSALFCEGLVSWMQERYRGRFDVYEESPVQRIDVGDGAILHAGKYLVEAEHAVLCTNGYLDLEISGANISIKETVRGVIGFMVGYLHHEDKGPAAAVYFDDGKVGRANDYFYLARRKYIRGQCRELMSVGGPDMPLEAGSRYKPTDVPDAEERYAGIDEFYRGKIVDGPMSGGADFSWNGLMGYTNSGVRMIGPDPGNPSLVYNLGCNGIGILPAIYGGKRVSRFVNGELLDPSIFDPIHVLRRARNEE